MANFASLFHLACYQTDQQDSIGSVGATTTYGLDNVDQPGGVVEEEQHGDIFKELVPLIGADDLDEYLFPVEDFTTMDRQS